MTKLSKLLRTPDLFFKDAFRKRLKAKSPIVKNKIIKNEFKVIASPSYKINPGKLKINLVIFDDLVEDQKTKNTILKNQYRSIEKYTKFQSICYISKNIVSNFEFINVYKDYSDFYTSEVLKKINKNEIYIFISLNFFFLRNVKIEDFVDGNGRIKTFIKKNKTSDLSLQELTENYTHIEKCNFHPMENFCIANTANLVYFKHLETTTNTASYLFKTLPVMEVLVSHNILQETSIQYARLDYGYIEKLLWVQSVHGGKNCPLGITFDQKVSDINVFSKFLNNIFPHQSLLEENLISMEIL